MKNKILFLIGAICAWISGWLFGKGRCQQKLVKKANEIKDREDQNFKTLNYQADEITSRKEMGSEGKAKLTKIIDERIKINGKLETLNEILDDAVKW